MAETKATVTKTWASFKAGPADVNLQNQSPRHIVRYVSAASTPTTQTGISLHPGEIHPVKIASGENLYVIGADADAGDILVAIDWAL